MFAYKYGSLFSFFYPVFTLFYDLIVVSIEYITKCIEATPTVLTTALNVRILVLNLSNDNEASIFISGPVS